MEDIIDVLANHPNESAYKNVFPRQNKSVIIVNDIPTNIIITGKPSLIEGRMTHLWFC